MALNDRQKGNITGYSGLSELVSDVEDRSPVCKQPPQITPPPSPTPTSEPQLRRAGDAPSDSTVSPPAKAKSDSSSEVATGKWMIGIGLGIGLLLIILVNATKNDAPRSTTPPDLPAPTTVETSYSPPTVPSVMQVQQPAHETVIEQNTATESVTVLGQQVVFSNPRDYCTPGKSAREAALMDLAARSLGEGSRLVHAAVRCSELEDYRKGRREILDHWLQIQLIGLKGNFERIKVPRETFLSGISNSIPRANPEELNQRLRASFENSDINLSEMNFEPIGRDGNAVYFSMRMNMSIGGSNRPISGLSATTLLNYLPLAINVYEGTGSPHSRAQLQVVQQELLNSLLTEN